MIIFCAGTLDEKYNDFFGNQRKNCTDTLDYEAFYKIKKQSQNSLLKVGTETNYSMLAYINSAFKADSIGKYIYLLKYWFAIISIVFSIDNLFRFCHFYKSKCTWPGEKYLQARSICKVCQFCIDWVPCYKENWNFSIRKRSFNEHVIWLIFKFATFFVVNLVVDKIVSNNFSFFLCSPSTAVLLQGL